MSDYKRYFVPGGTFFFTVVTYRRREVFISEQTNAILGDVIRECQADRPFTINVIVLLPDHLHAILSMPPGDADYSTRWGWIKKEFGDRWLAAGGSDWPVSHGQQRERRRGIWQRRFWEHSIADPDEFDAYFDYIHFNPVKHGYVKRPHEWSASSFHRWVKAGVYPQEWAEVHAPDFTAIKNDCGEP